jgi:Domain of unknown function (DUF4832)/Domain of unknown function (DUF4874)
VIAIVQSGFVGPWGEGHSSTYFGSDGSMTSANWADRKAIVDKLLSILPPRLKVQVRTPTMKMQMYGSAPATANDRTNATAVGRVGHHNDCFLASRTDSGTYKDPAVEYPYLASDTTNVPMGGETCGSVANPPRSECPTALDELRKFHYSYLNIDWSLVVLDTWRAGGCMPQVDRQLGYRFALQSVTSSTTATQGTTMGFNMTIRNDGWSHGFTQRPVQLVLRNTVTHKVHKLSLTSTRNWYAGVTRVFTAPTLKLPATVPAGTYELLLNIPDPSGTLANRPEYAVQLANTDLWEAATGWNRLNRTLKVN